MGQLSGTVGISSQTKAPVPLAGLQAGSLPRRLHLLTELIKLLLLKLCHDSVESIDLNRETDILAMEAAVATTVSGGAWWAVTRTGQQLPSRDRGESTMRHGGLVFMNGT